MDGYMVIDMSLMCNPDEFEATPYEQPWLLGGGQKTIGKIKSGSGCTNAAMLAYTADKFPEGIYLIGSCPSVGITGYATGGGQGDTTPWVGLGIDDVLSYDIVLYDGTPVTASATENDDLYWALRGGGSGFGVITSLTTAVISPPEETSKFTWVSASYKQTPNEAREFLKRFQDFLVPDLPIGSKEYKEKIRATSAKFGGAATFDTNSDSSLGFAGLFLGNKAETNSTFDEARLLENDMLDIWTEVEFSSWADSQLFILCNTLGSDDIYWTLWVNPYWRFTGEFPIYQVDICGELNIASTNCYRNSFEALVPKCNATAPDFNETALKTEILPALKDVAKKPQSWINRPGAQRMAEFGYWGLDNKIYEDIDFLSKEDFEEYIFGSQDSWFGGLLHGRLHPDVLLEMANVGVPVFHFAHGAPTLVERDETAYFGREEYSLLNLADKKHYDDIASILVNKAYDGDASKLRGFYNYLNPEGNSNWRHYYFGDNYERLSVVKAKYDETNGFGNPLQVEPAPLSKDDKLKPRPKVVGYGQFKSIGYDMDPMPVTGRLGFSSSTRIPIKIMYPAEENPTLPEDNFYVIPQEESVNNLLARICSPTNPDTVYCLPVTLQQIGDALPCIPDVPAPLNPTGSDVTVTRGAAPARGERGLIVFSHGLYLAVTMYTGLLAKLASHGFVVAAPVYNDADYAVHYPDARIAICNRFREVRKVIDFMTTKENAEKYGIDPKRVVAMGHSFGGATTLSTVLGGSLKSLGSRCDLVFSDIPNLSEPDDRVDLAVTLAQTSGVDLSDIGLGFVSAFTPTEIEQLKVPVLALSIKNDDTSPPAVHVNDIFNKMKCMEKDSMRVEIEDGDHSGSFTDIYAGLDLSFFDETIGSGAGGCETPRNTVGLAWKLTLEFAYRDMSPAEQVITTAYPVLFLNSFLLGEKEDEEFLERDNAYEPEVLDLVASVFVDDKCDADALFE